MKMRSIVRCAQALALAIGMTAGASPFVATPAHAIEQSQEFLIWEITYKVCQEVKPGITVCQNASI